MNKWEMSAEMETSLNDMSNGKAGGKRLQENHGITDEEEFSKFEKLISSLGR